MLWVVLLLPPVSDFGLSREMEVNVMATMTSALECDGYRHLHVSHAMATRTCRIAMPLGPPLPSCPRVPAILPAQASLGAHLTWHQKS